jgi:hypothetical protein
VDPRLGSRATGPAESLVPVISHVEYVEAVRQHMLAGLGILEVAPDTPKG